MIDIVLTVLGVAGIFIPVLIIFKKRIMREIVEIVDNIGDLFESILSTPTVKGAMSVLGKKSADASASRKIVDSLATDILSGPKLKALKMGAKQIGIDVDQYIEENGALETLSGIQEIAGYLGIDVNQILQGGVSELSSPGQPGGSSPYL